MKEKQLPGIVFIMRSSGGAGRELFRSLNSNEQMKSLQDRFVLILTSEKDEPEGEKWNPGTWNDWFRNVDSKSKYYPRVFFADKDMNIDYDINNAGYSPLHLFYYYDAESVYKNALRYLSHHQLIDDDPFLEYEL